MPSTSHCHSTEGGDSKAERELRADQLFDSALPPFKGRATRVDEYREGLWAFTQPLPIPLVGDPDLRMTVARLQDGSLWVGHSGLNPALHSVNKWASAHLLNAIPCSGVHSTHSFTPKCTLYLTSIPELQKYGTIPNTQCFPILGSTLQLPLGIKDTLGLKRSPLKLDRIIGLY